jgi:hypothetical protein
MSSSISFFSLLLNRFGLALFILLSVAMTFCIEWFYIDDFLPVPQFEHFDEELWKYSINAIHAAKKKWPYITFFIVDFWWALLLVMLPLRWIVRICKPGKNILNISSLGIIIIAFFFISAYVLDLMEGGFYIYGFFKGAVNLNIFSKIVGAKKLFYVVSLVILLFVFYEVHKQKIKFHIPLFFKSLWLTLLFIVLVGLLLTQMEQGSSLIIALADHPLQLLLGVFLLYNLSHIFSHYPAYFLYYFNKDIKDQHWIRHKNNCFDYGILTYNLQDNDQFKNLENSFNVYRYLTGSLVLLAMAYAILYTYGRYIKPGTVLYVNLIVIFLIVMIVIFINFEKNNTLDESNSRSQGKMYGKGFSKFLVVLHIFSWFSLLMALISSAYLGWSIPTFLLMLTFLFSMSFYRFFQPKAKELYGSHNRAWLYVLQNTEYTLTGELLNKLSFIKWSGFVSFGIFMASHVPQIGMQINPIVIILAYIHILYGAILITFKNYMYYEWRSVINNGTSSNKKLEISENPNRILSFVFRHMWWFLILGFAAKQFYNNQHNKLHYLEEYSYKKEHTMSLDSFIQYRAGLPQDTNNVNYYIASWGGGLRATYYNLLWLDQFNMRDTSFRKNVVAMSGVSGGGLGIHFYFANLKENNKKGNERISQVIDSIGAGNFVSTDLSYLLGRDRLGIRELGIRDRSITGMKNYWSIIQNRCIPMDTSVYQTYWKKGFDQLTYYPLLISNATKTTGNYGVAFSAGVDDLTFDTIFRGATNMLSLPEKSKSLSFFEAVSASERFPFFSATASVQGQGHYIDGGYFDNSGLISLMNLRKYIRQKSTHTSTKDALIIIGNSKDHYIYSLLMKQKRDESQEVFVKLRGESDIESILKGVITTDRLANYLTHSYHNIIRDSILEVKFNCLQYPIRYNDFISYLGACPADSTSVDVIRRLIKNNNNELRVTLEEYYQNEPKNKKNLGSSGIKWYFAYPSLSRYLSQPTVNYYKAVMKQKAG